MHEATSGHNSEAVCDPRYENVSGVARRGPASTPKRWPAFRRLRSRSETRSTPRTTSRRPYALAGIGEADHHLGHAAEGRPAVGAKARRIARDRTTVIPVGLAADPVLARPRRSGMPRGGFARKARDLGRCRRDRPRQGRVRASAEGHSNRFRAWQHQPSLTVRAQVRARARISRIEGGAVCPATGRPAAQDR